MDKAKLLDQLDSFIGDGVITEVSVANVTVLTSSGFGFDNMVRVDEITIKIQFNKRPLA